MSWNGHMINRYFAALVPNVAIIIALSGCNGIEGGGSVDEAFYTASRVFAGPGEFPPEGYAAYGIVALAEKPTSETAPIYQAICEAYVSTLISSSQFLKEGIPLKQQMVTAWPLTATFEQLGEIAFLRMESNGSELEDYYERSDLKALQAELEQEFEKYEEKYGSPEGSWRLIDEYRERGIEIDLEGRIVTDEIKQRFPEYYLLMNSMNRSGELTADGTSDLVCHFAVEYYDYVAAKGSIDAARRMNSGVRLNSRGPFLLAWSPGSNFGKSSDNPVLFADLSGVNNRSEALRYFRQWREDIEGNPELWRRGGWSKNAVKTTLRNWFTKNGERVLFAFNKLGEIL